MSRHSVMDAVQAAVTTSPAEDWARCPSAGVRLFGARAGVAYRLDSAEMSRRATVGLGAITQRDVLEALMGLPASLPVTTSALTPREQQTLRRAPRGALNWEHDSVIRQAVPTLSARFAVVAASTWRDGLAKAGRFAPFCARAILLPEPPADLDDARVQASFYGIGLCVFTTGTLRMLVPPESYVRQRHSSAQWWFTEEIHRQLLASDLAAIPGTSSARA